MIEGAGAISLTAEAEGDAYAIPVLLAHGGGQTRRAWRRVVSELLKPAFAQSPSTWAVTETAIGRHAELTKCAT